MAGPPSSKRQRTADPALATSRIEGLTTDLLLLVLSNLGARFAVQTCALSPRFRDLWRSLPCINATCEEFEDDEGIVNEASFKTFTNRFLARRESVGIHKFRLCYSISGDAVHGDGAVLEDLEACYVDANDWIRKALKHDARIVEVENRAELLRLDPDVFTSKCLERLRIRGAILVEGFFEQLERGCPGLKELYLSDCSIMDHEFSSPTLELLTLRDEVGFIHDERPVTISAPSLKFFAFARLHAGRLPSLINMASLEKAWILISQSLKDVYASDIKQFLEALSGVTRLTFYLGHSKLTMEKDYQWCPKFSNLTDLVLEGWCVHEDFYALIVFLQNSPNLKKLTLELDKPRLFQGGLCAIVGELEERSFTCDQLEIVNIICSEQALLSKVKQLLLDGGVELEKIHNCRN